MSNSCPYFREKYQNLKKRQYFIIIETSWWIANLMIWANCIMSIWKIMKRSGVVRYASVKYFSFVVIKQVLLSTIKCNSNNNDQVIFKTIPFLHSSVNSLSKSSLEILNIYEINLTSNSVFWLSMIQDFCLVSEYILTTATD